MSEFNEPATPEDDLLTYVDQLDQGRNEFLDICDAFALQPSEETGEALYSQFAKNSTFLHKAVIELAETSSPDECVRSVATLSVGDDFLRSTHMNMLVQNAFLAPIQGVPETEKELTERYELISSNVLAPLVEMGDACAEDIREKYEESDGKVAKFAADILNDYTEAGASDLDRFMTAIEQAHERRTTLAKQAAMGLLPDALFSLN
ncbi:MAG TPA: hypothetical protein VIJ25_07465 [Methylococcales bacterium]